jgi:hypothetical protein
MNSTTEHKLRGGHMWDFFRKLERKQTKSRVGYSLLSETSLDIIHLSVQLQDRKGADRLATGHCSVMKILTDERVHSSEIN